LLNENEKNSIGLGYSVPGIVYEPGHTGLGKFQIILQRGRY